MLTSKTLCRKTIIIGKSLYLQRATNDNSYEWIPNKLVSVGWSVCLQAQLYIDSNTPSVFSDVANHFQIVFNSNSIQRLFSVFWIFWSHALPDLNRICIIRQFLLVVFYFSICIACSCFSIRILKLKIVFRLGKLCVRLGENLNVEHTWMLEMFLAHLLKDVRLTRENRNICIYL